MYLLHFELLLKIYYSLSLPLEPSPLVCKTVRLPDNNPPQRRADPRSLNSTHTQKYIYMQMIQKYY